mmetsp:Transcript_12070/g.34522  ORF Transcript_12070/g.34522 Transcript_12070/m.34522 type:complete len:260 (-) Transcript_12070:314-1093(-)
MRSRRNASAPPRHFAHDGWVDAAPPPSGADPGAMLDRFAARAHGPGDALGPVGVRRHRESVVLCGRNHRHEVVEGELAFGRVGARRADAAGRHDFDPVSTALGLPADHGLCLRGAGNGAAPLVAMTSRNGNRLPCTEEPWALHLTARDHVPELDGGKGRAAAQVASRCDAFAHHAKSPVLHCGQELLGRLRRLLMQPMMLAELHVHVRVDKAGHQATPFVRLHGQAARARFLRGAHAQDRLALEHHAEAGHSGVGLAVP